MMISDKLKNSQRLAVYFVARHLDTNDNYIVFNIGTHVYCIKEEEFTSLVVENKYYEKVLSYSLDALINGTYLTDQDESDIEYYVDYIIPDYNQDINNTQPLVLFRQPGFKESFVIEQDKFLDEERFEFKGFTYKTSF